MAQLLRTAPPTLLLCWRASYSSRCTPSRCWQCRSPLSCSAPASHPATYSARGQAAEPLPLRGRPPLPVRPFSAGGERRKRGARRPVTSQPLGGAAPGLARHLPERTRRGCTRSAQILAIWPSLCPHSVPRAHDPIRTILPPWLTCGSRSALQREFAAQQHGRCILRAAL